MVSRLFQNCQSFPTAGGILSSDVLQLSSDVLQSLSDVLQLSSDVLQSLIDVFTV